MLPNELLMHIFMECSFKELHRLALTCKRIHGLLSPENNWFWKKKLNMEPSFICLGRYYDLLKCRKLDYRVIILFHAKDIVDDTREILWSEYMNDPEMMEDYYFDEDKIRTLSIDCIRSVKKNIEQLFTFKKLNGDYIKLYGYTINIDTFNYKVKGIAYANVDESDVHSYSTIIHMEMNKRCQQIIKPNESRHNPSIVFTDFHLEQYEINN